VTGKVEDVGDVACDVGEGEMSESRECSWWCRSKGSGLYQLVLRVREVEDVADYVGGRFGDVGWWC
jgi:hypothetical protein